MMMVLMSNYGMDGAYEAKYHIQEEKHWWFETRRDIIINLLKRSDRNSKILEIGCSGGPLIQALNHLGFKNVQGIDISQQTIDLCKWREIHNAFVMDGSKPEFEDGQFDIVIASDVLEHIEDEEKALSEWNRILRPAGKLIVFVPAFEILWSKHDEANHHYRRYSKSELIHVLEKAEFEIDRSSYWNFILFFPTGLVRLLQRIVSKYRQQSGDQLVELNPVANKLLVYLVKTENIFLKVLNFPIGVSVFAIAGKKNASAPSVASPAGECPKPSPV
jgi:2-polyprenyl-3-methyl-5-hydroxy-6-metoxy-1,4-benzoquinol methylase